MTNTDKIAEFAPKVGIMKPGSVKKGDMKAEAKLDLLLDDPAYAIEEKIDGAHYKMIANRFFSADNVEKTHNFPHLHQFFSKLGMGNLILDGEIHYPGKTSQFATHVTGSLPTGAHQFQELNGLIHYTLFDILRTPKGNWTIRNTYQERRRLLEYFYNTFIADTPMAEFIHLTEVRYEGKREFVEQLLAEGKEGGVLKLLTSQYHMGKKPMWQWMKIKQEDEADLIIIGYDPPKMNYTGSNIDTWEFWKEVDGEQIPVTEYYYRGWIGSLVLGAYIDGQMTRICTASGFNKALRKEISENPEAYMGRVVKTTYMERTSDGFPRHPVFKMFHEGKLPEECTWEF